MKTRFSFAAAVLAALAALSPAADDAAKDKPSVRDQLAVAQKVGASLAQVEYTLQYDKGEAPAAGAQGADCVSPLEQERPFEAPAFLVSPTMVITPDPMLHPRFVKEIAVRFGDERVKASPSGYATGQDAVFLKLEKPLKGATPLAFDKGRKAPYLAVTYTLTDGAWTVNVSPFSPSPALARDGRRVMGVSADSLVVDSEGLPVGMAMNDEVAADDSWKGSPLDWPTMSAEQMAQNLKKLDQRFTQSVFLVRLNFRSPKKNTSLSRYGEEGQESATQQHVIGALIDANRILVLADLKPKLTARLLSITALPPGTEPVEAKFACTLKDYGAFLATPTKPMPGPVVIYDGKVTDFRNRLLLAAEVKIEGEKCTNYFLHSRIHSFELGWKRQLFPNARTATGGLVLFDGDGKLVAFPISKRQKVSSERYASSYAMLTPAAHLIPVMAELARNSDPSNVPLTEDEENRLAWLGVVLQPLDRELARINKVSDLTQNGRIGAIVSYIYPGSPAEQAKMQVGDVLIRLYVEELPKPIDIAISDYGFSSRPFPWNRLDEVPEQYYDQIPRPWPPAENNLTRMLTDLGFGKKFTLEMSRDGKAFRREMTISASPPHYDSAAKFKSEPLGLTVKDITYELRRYFQMTDDAPGVIVAKIEPGSKTSVAGIKPYEIVTHVNDQPVKTVKDFEKLAAAGGELRLSIQRMTKGRVAKITLEPPGSVTKPAPKPDEGREE